MHVSNSTVSLIVAVISRTSGVVRSAVPHWYALVARSWGAQPGRAHDTGNAINCSRPSPKHKHKEPSNHAQGCHKADQHKGYARYQASLIRPDQTGQGAQKDKDAEHHAKASVDASCEDKLNESASKVPVLTTSQKREQGVPEGLPPCKDLPRQCQSSECAYVSCIDN